eukprot:gene28683-biopygen32594
MESVLYIATSRVIEAFSKKPPTLEENIASYSKNEGDSAFSSALMNQVGLAASSDRKPLRIIDVGCGRRTSAGQIASLIPAASAEYTCIDKAMPETCGFAARSLKLACGVGMTEILGDVFDETTTTDLVSRSSNRFDLVIIDVEPHGREIDVYEKIVGHLADTHLVLLKHVCSIALFGSAYADCFLAKYDNEGKVMDYLAVKVLNGWFHRDLYVLMTQHGGVRGSRTHELFRASVAAEGRTLRKYAYLNKDYRTGQHILGAVTGLELPDSMRENLIDKTLQSLDIDSYEFYKEKLKQTNGANVNILDGCPRRVAADQGHTDMERILVVDVENLNRGTASVNRSTASVIDDGQLSEIRAAENMLLQFAIPDFTHIAPSPTDRTINVGHLPEQLVTINGAIFNMAWDNTIHVSQKCTLQLIGRLTTAWGYECNGKYMSGITWTVDRIYVEFDPTKSFPQE